jgi:hypothetical protein
MFDAEATIQDLHANLEYLEKAGLDSYVPWDHIVSHMTPYLGTSIRKHYESLVGLKFDVDSLPDPEELFVNGDVRAVFQEIRNIHREFPRLAQAIERLQSVRSAAVKWGKESARIALNIASIRRIPYVVLRNLVRQALDGRPISYTDALPKLCDDGGRVVTLEEFLTYALQ